METIRETVLIMFARLHRHSSVGHPRTVAQWLHFNVKDHGRFGIVRQTKRTLIVKCDQVRIRSYAGSDIRILPGAAFTFRLAKFPQTVDGASPDLCHTI